MDDVGDWLRGRRYYEGQITDDRTVPGSAASQRAVPLESRLSDALDDRGIDSLYGHQADAVEAISSARGADQNRLVVDALLPRFARELRWIDDRLSGYEGDTRVAFVEREAAGYVVITETCRAVPSVSGDVAAALRGDGDA